MTARTRKADDEQAVTADPEVDAKPAADSKADSKSDKATSKSDASSSSGTSYLNVTTGPLVYSREGHTVGAGEWTPEVNLDAIGQAARRNSFLLPPSAL
jgi:hypothetical protein